MKRFQFIMVLCVLLLIGQGIFSQGALPFLPDVRPGYGVTGMVWLSDYFPSIRNTSMDTRVYFLDSGKEGATFLLFGGVHPREIAGTSAAMVFIENVIVTRGRVIVIPFTNSSGFSIPDELGSSSHFLEVEGKSGPRILVYGDRRTSLEDQGVEDPELYIHYPTGSVVGAGDESRNLNRAFPGKIDGTPTQQLAYAIMELIRQENVDFNLDMHESDTPEQVTLPGGQIHQGGRLAYMLVCHPSGLEIGALALFEVEDQGIPMKLEESSIDFRGLSHREIGDATHCISFLSESPNPGQDRWRDQPLVLDDPKYPIEHRVGMHFEVIRALIESFALFTGKEIHLEGLPSEKELITFGIGAYLN